MYVSLLQCRPKTEICRLKPVTCRPAQEHSRHEPVTDCRPKPPCVVTDIPKRGTVVELCMHIGQQVALHQELHLMFFVTCLPMADN